MDSYCCNVARVYVCLFVCPWRSVGAIGEGSPWWVWAPYYGGVRTGPIRDKPETRRHLVVWQSYVPFRSPSTPFPQYEKGSWLTFFVIYFLLILSILSLFYQTPFPQHPLGVSECSPITHISLGSIMITVIVTKCVNKKHLCLRRRNELVSETWPLSTLSSHDPSNLRSPQSCFQQYLES